MSVLDDIKDDLTDLQTLHMIATSFTDTAAMRIRGIREAFETNQEFYAELSHVYHLVKLVAIKQGLIPDGPPNAKTLLVAFTANQHFYGSIHRRIMDFIMKERDKTHADLLVIGTTGKEYLTVSGQSDGFKLMHFEKDDPTPEEVTKFLETIHDYTSIRVYYPHFMSLMRQDVGMIDITQVQEMDGQTTQDVDTYILFEPEVDKILEFFERQIRGVLFKRVVLESDLSRTAARMVSMNEASERAQEMMKEKHSEYLKVMRSFINRQLLDTFSGMSLWKDK
jgi:F-type H+-transporting ATPase subunit gamma